MVKHRKIKLPEVSRIAVVIGVSMMITFIIIMRLFYLQIIKHSFYEKVAAQAHYGYSELPARRGEIFIKDYASDELIRVATNTTLDLVFADTVLIKNKETVVNRIAPIIFNLEEARAEDEERIKIEKVKAKTQEELDKIKALTDAELYTKFYNFFLDTVRQEIRVEILLTDELEEDILNKIAALNLPGIEVVKDQLLAYPVQITDRGKNANALSAYLQIPVPRLEIILKGLNRHAIIKRKISPEASAKIKKIIKEDENETFAGIRLEEEYYRYYPEEKLAANLLGFVTIVNKNAVGQYGIEGKFNTQLQGKKGIFEAQLDSIGRQITVGDSLIQPAVDGDDIILTIDRSIQMAVEEMVERNVKNFRADNGQVIVMEPKAGKIIAMANYPTFDPNKFTEVYEKEPINLTEQEIAALVPIETEEGNFWLYRDVRTQDRIKIFKEELEDGTFLYKKYKNLLGPEAYQNKAVSQSYEPGSIFKIVTMASAIDDGDVTPSTTINDPGFLELDFNSVSKKYDFIIKNVSARCTGRVNMTWIIQYSCNTGISYVAKEMGRNLFYSYIKKFGFGERTEIEFDNEAQGKIEHFDQWTESELATHGFGQGITVTPIQMISSYATIANKGVLMQPYIVDSVQHKNGKVTKTEPKALQTVISKESANIMAAMLVNNVENGESYGRIRFPDHYIGAKTGTAQTYRNGRALSGAGTTITTVVGFAPIEDPKFVILAKMDRPRTIEWADSTAAIMFKDVSNYLFDYFSIPPDKK